jgi:2-aminoadipate transaminase
MTSLFPFDDFRASCAAVLDRKDLADILQLGSPMGFEPLRQRLLADARKERLAGDDDDLIVTNGCQQALDLIGRVLVRPGDAVAVEDPIYPGLKNLLTALGARLLGIPVGAHGISAGKAERVLRERPRFLVVTSNFQNPTGTTMPVEARKELVEAAKKFGVPIVENDAYGDLRYRGQPIPAIKRLDEAGGTILLRSFSKVSFPGLRVGWALGPKPFIDRLRQSKEAADLHTDQLSQAVLLEFLESGRLEAHRDVVRRCGDASMVATMEGCRRYLPRGTKWTEPQGGMNVWVTLPAPIDADQLLREARREGVAFLPGRFFAVTRHDPGTLRLSFAGIAPETIFYGLRMLGVILAGDAPAVEAPTPAMV